MARSPGGPRKTSLRWTRQRPPKWRQFRRSQTRKDTEVSWWSAEDVTPLDSPAALESGDCFADRSPPGMARSQPPRDGEDSWWSA
eukprot:2913096-Pyramimonas_sp.AAC.1